MARNPFVKLKGQVMMTRTNQSSPLPILKPSIPDPSTSTLRPERHPHLSPPTPYSGRCPWVGPSPMSDHKNLPPPAVEGSMSSLYKQHSWSPDLFREEVWLRRKEGSKRRSLRRSRSVTDEDLDELKACIELGFGFDSPEPDQKLSDTLPALGLYYAVNKRYNDRVLVRTSSAASSESDADFAASPQSIFGPRDNPQKVKTKLRQWAQVVACTVRQSRQD